MSTAQIASLTERRNDLTRRLILQAAVEMLERGSVADLTVRAAARQANMSERTIFRYFASRDEFLDAVAAAVAERLALPPPPRTRDELLAAPRALYSAFEARARLTEAALHSELFPRIRDRQARARWVAVRKLVDALAPRSGERERRIAAANIRYFLAASTWYYYRRNFAFTLEDAIACAEAAVLQALAGLRPARG